MTENTWGEPLGMNVARRLKDEIRGDDRLTASAGVAPNKFLAKIASGWQKPDGLTVVAPERVETFLQGLPDRRALGRGARHGAASFGRTASRSSWTSGRGRFEELRTIVGSAAEWLQQLAHGIDDRPVEPNRGRKSVGSENTFSNDLTELHEIREAVGDMAREIGEWMARKSVYARTVTLKVRYDDFSTITRSHSDPRATNDVDAIARRAIALLDKTEAGVRPVRLLGVSAHNLQDSPDPTPHADPQGIPWLPFDD